MRKEEGCIVIKRHGDLQIPKKVGRRQRRRILLPVTTILILVVKWTSKLWRRRQRGMGMQRDELELVGMRVFFSFFSMCMVIGYYYGELGVFFLIAWYTVPFFRLLRDSYFSFLL